MNKEQGKLNDECGFPDDGAKSKTDIVVKFVNALTRLRQLRAKFV